MDFYDKSMTAILVHGNVMQYDAKYPGQMALVVKNTPTTLGDTEMWAGSLGWEDPLEEEMATHSSILS